jgi:hypothetical protein
VAELIVDAGELVLHLPTRQKMAGFHKDIRVPLTAVRSVKPLDDPWMALRGRRMSGTVLRGVVAMGTWIHSDNSTRGRDTDWRRHLGTSEAGFDFVVLRKQQRGVQVDLNAGRFARFIVGVPADTDPKEEARRIAAAAGIAPDKA